jgi:hypothetical protein
MYQGKPILKKVVKTNPNNPTLYKNIYLALLLVWKESSTNLVLPLSSETNLDTTQVSKMHSKKQWNKSNSKEGRTLVCPKRLLRNKSSKFRCRDMSPFTIVIKTT